MIVIDEAHCLVSALDGNKISKSFALLKACTQSKKVLLLTGTPFQNKIEDLYVYFLALTKEIFHLDHSTKRSVVDRFRLAKLQDDKGSLNISMFHTLFQEKVLFRSNQEGFATVKYVDNDFQEHDTYIDSARKWNTIICEMTKKETKAMEKAGVKCQNVPTEPLGACDDDESDIASELSDRRNLKTKCHFELVRVNTHMHFTENQFHHFENIINFYGKDNSFPMVIYATYKKEVDRIKDHLLGQHYEEYNPDHSTSRNRIRFATITCSTKNREAIVNEFNKGVIDIILVSNAGATGTDLRGPSGVKQIHIMNLYWNPAIIDQIVGRGWRKGAHQEGDTLRVFLYVSKTFGAPDPDGIMTEYIIGKKRIYNELRLILSKAPFNVDADK